MLFIEAVVGQGRWSGDWPPNAITIYAYRASGSPLLANFPISVSQASWVSLSSTDSSLGIRKGVRAEVSWKGAKFGGKACLSSLKL